MHPRERTPPPEELLEPRHVAEPLGFSKSGEQSARTGLCRVFPPAELPSCDMVLPGQACEFLILSNFMET